MNDLFGNVESKIIPKMPDEYKGKIGNSCGYTKTNPRTWTEDELQWVRRMRDEGYSNKEIAESTGRSAVSIQIKLKRLGKTSDTYNKHHLRDKYACNEEYYRTVNPSTILDLYCGVKSYWKNHTNAIITTNDCNPEIEADNHERAEMIIHRLYYENKKFDVVDLDPYGSAFECFDLCIKMAQKGIIITFGELGHKRWKRLDFVKRYYGIQSMDEFNLKNLVDVVQMIAARNKKELIPVISRTWDRIGRVWFIIKPLSITEQWEPKNK